MTLYATGAVVRVRYPGPCEVTRGLWGVSLACVVEAVDPSAPEETGVYKVVALADATRAETGWEYHHPAKLVELVVSAGDLEPAEGLEADEFLRSLRSLHRDVWLKVTEVREFTRRCWSCERTYVLRYRRHRQMPSVATEFACPACGASLEEVASFAERPEVELAEESRSRRTRS